MEVASSLEYFIVGFMVFAMSMFPSFADMGNSLDEMMSGFSPEMTKAFSFNLIDLQTDGLHLLYVSVFSHRDGSWILTGKYYFKEESDQTIDFLYAHR